MLPEWKKIGVLSRFLTGKHIGKKPSRRLRRRWEDSIRMYLK